MTVILILISFCGLLKAPNYKSGYIVRSEPINYYTPLIKAVVMVESNNGKYLFNPAENAIGFFQIRECRIKEFNNLTGKNYTHAEMHDYSKAREVFLYYCRGRDYETIARAWAGGESGTKKATNDYWSKVKSHL